MLVLSMNVSVDGYVNDRQGGLGWSVLDDEVFAFHLEAVRSLGGYLLGRRLYEAMLVWETDPALRVDAARSAFADAWSALPKVVFSGTLDAVQGNARLATAPLAQEVSAAVASTDRDVAIGGAGLAASAWAAGLVEEIRLVRHPVLVGGGTLLLPPVADAVALTLLESRTVAGQVGFERYRVGRGTTQP